jgi:2-C-methyl-D-erythritol 4-phosphate cytidylyltransferase
VAAGQGVRLGKEFKDIPKALVPVLGRPMLFYSLNAFGSMGKAIEDETIDQYVITVPPGSIEEFTKLITEWGFSHPVTLVEGGETRAESVSNALHELEEDPPDYVLIHDCARACITPEMIKQMLKIVKELDEFEETAATLASRPVDTLRIFSEGYIASEVDRESIACIETPQVFLYGRLLELHETCEESELTTDDTTLFTRADEKVRLVFHDGCNMKITYPEDIGMAEGVLCQRGWRENVKVEN